MKECNIIGIIKQTLQNGYIGDDCAYLKELGIVVSQDSLVENVHFKRNWYTPHQLGYKSAIVNISDILASGAVPKYLTVSLSLPGDIDENFIREFYLGVKSVNDDIEIIGGDITGTNNGIFISITAIGITKGRRISSRKNAKTGYSIITTGEYGSSAKGLAELCSGKFNGKFVKSHVEPILDYNFSEQIASIADEDYAMMDTSDGLCDALFKIAEASNVKIEIDYNKIPHQKGVSKNDVLFGGEDYNLISAVPAKMVSSITNAVVIGNVIPYDGIRLDISGEKYKKYDELSVYNHFGE